MIRGYASKSGRLSQVEDPISDMNDLVWIDLISPTQEEYTAVERSLGVAIPTRADMEEIEISSRLYNAKGAAFMTALLPANSDGEDPEMGPVTFILSDHRLVTVRFHGPRPFETYPRRAETVPMGCESGEAVLFALLETVVDRLADILEHIGSDFDRISRKVFRGRGNDTSPRGQNFRDVLETIGRKGDLTSNIRDSLLTMDRLVGFLGQRTFDDKVEAQRERIDTLSRDVRSIADHASFLSQKTTLLLDATLGMINIEQNAIIKIFSVAAVAFLPPTLIASIYGMNFAHMPELKWPLGYPLAVGLMVLSAVLPYLYFRRRGWL